MMLTEDPLTTIRNLSSGVTVRDIPLTAPLPETNGEPGTAVKPPVLVLIEKPLTLLLPLLPTYRKFFTLLVAMPFAAFPPAPPTPAPPLRKGEPGSGVSAPFAATENAEILF